MNSQHKNKNSNGILHSKIGLKRSSKGFWYTKINLTQIWYDEFNLIAFAKPILSPKYIFHHNFLKFYENQDLATKKLPLINFNIENTS